MTNDDSWIADWLCKKLEEHDEVEEAQTVGSHAIKITRTNNQDCLVVAAKVPCLNSMVAEEYLGLVSEPDFLMNMDKNAYVTAGGYRVLAQNRVGFGSLGELYSALAICNISDFVGSKAKFVLRALDQHTGVRSVSRVADCAYSIQTYGGKEIAAVMIDEYELGADHVRVAIQRYSPVDLLVSSNPNATVSGQAQLAAKSSGVRLIEKWKHFMGFLAS